MTTAQVPTLSAEAVTIEERTPFQIVMMRFRRHRLATIALGLGDEWGFQALFGVAHGFCFGLAATILLALLSCKEPWGVIALLAAGTVPPFLELRARGKPTRVFTLHMALFIVLLMLGYRIGTATGLQETVLKIPRSLVTGITELTFEITPMGGGRRAFSEKITAHPGEEIVLRIGP